VLSFVLITGSITAHDQQAASECHKINF